MPCVTIRDEQGNTTGHACIRGRAPKLCLFCRIRSVSKLCDYPIGRNKTCDAGMCDRCATPKGPEIDYCPTHMDRDPEQQSLFGERKCA